MTSDSKRGKGFDISKLNIFNDKKLTVANSLAKQLDILNPSFSLFAKVHKSSALSSFTKSIEIPGLSAMQSPLDTRSIGGLAETMRSLDKLSLGINERIFPSALRGLEMGALRNTLSAINTGSLGQVIKDINRSLSLGIPSAFMTELNLSISGMAKQMQALGSIERVTQTTLHDVGFQDLETLLSKSLEVHETLLEEQKQATLDAQLEAKFNRRLAVMAIIINIIMLLIMLANEIEDRMIEDDVEIMNNTAAIVQMSKSFEVMASEMKAIRESQNEKSQRETKADEKIAEILRNIAEALNKPPEQPDN